MTELAYRIDLEKSEQKSINLICIMEEKLTKKIDELNLDIDRKFQSLEAAFCNLQNALNKLMLTFLEGQEERHSELMRVSEVLNQHNTRIEKLERKIKEK